MTRLAVQFLVSEGPARQVGCTSLTNHDMNMASPRPTKLRMDGADLVIEWDNGRTSRYSPGQLRALCPCATCSELRAHAADDATPNRFSNIAFQTLTPVGNYAYQIAFSDGHDTGIYTLEYLYRLGNLGEG